MIEFQKIEELSEIEQSYIKELFKIYNSLELPTDDIKLYYLCDNTISILLNLYNILYVKASKRLKYIPIDLRYSDFDKVFYKQTNINKKTLEENKMRYFMSTPDDLNLIKCYIKRNYLRAVKFAEDDNLRKLEKENLRKSTERKNRNVTFEESPNSYTIIDTETTAPAIKEIVELAAIKIRDGIIVDTFQTLVKPSKPITNYDTSFNNITNAMVADSPSIETMLDKFLEFIGDDIIIGHNVIFDIDVINNEGKKYDRELTNDYICTLKLSKKVLPGLSSYRLESLLNNFNIKTDKRHRALIDCQDLFHCYKELCAIKLDNPIPPDFSHYIKLTKPKEPIKASVVTINESSPFYQKCFAFTGTLEKMEQKDAMQLVLDRGGLCSDNVTKKTNYLVVGNFDMCNSVKNGRSGKMKKADELHAQGLDVNVISENVFYDMLDF